MSPAVTCRHCGGVIAWSDLIGAWLHQADQPECDEGDPDAAT